MNVANSRRNGTLTFLFTKGGIELNYPQISINDRGLYGIEMTTAIGFRNDRVYIGFGCIVLGFGIGIFIYAKDYTNYSGHFK